MKRILKAAAFAVAVAVVLAGCSTDDESTSDGNGDSVLQLWVPGTLTDDIKEFAKTFPGAEVQITNIPEPSDTNLLTKLQTGEKPDLLYYHGVGNYLAQLNPQRYLEPLTDMEFVQNTKEGILENATEWDGEIYGAVVDYPAINGMLYNKEALASTGLEMPTNFADLLEWCDAVHAADPDLIPIDVAGSDKWPLQVLAFLLFNDGLQENPDTIDKLNRNEATFSDPVFMAGYQGLQEAHERGCFNADAATSTFETTLDRLVKGEAVATAALSIFTNNIKSVHGDAALEQLGFSPLSLETDVSSWQTVNQAIYVAQNDDPAKLQLAKDFVAWITGDGYQDYIDLTVQYPVINTAEAPSGDFPTVLVEADEAFQANTVAQFQQNLRAAYGQFESYLSDMLFGGQTPEYVGEQMQQQFARNAKLAGLEGF